MAAPQPVNQFEVARKRAATQETANLQGQKDAIARRAAQLGGGPSGAMIKQEGIAADESAKRMQAANEGIDVAEQSENRRIREVQEGREFQTKERLGSQDFGASQADLQRRYGTSERLGSQDFGATQADIQRRYGTTEREAGQSFGASQADIQRRYGTSEREAGQTFGADQAQLARLFQTSERMGAQQYGTTEREAGQAFGADQARLDRVFQSDESRLARNLQSSQFDKQLGFQKNQAAQQRYMFDKEQTNFDRTFAQAGAEFEWTKHIDQKNLELADRIQASNARSGGIFGSIFGDFNPGGGGGVGGNMRKALNPFS